MPRGHGGVTTYDDRLKVLLNTSEQTDLHPIASLISYSRWDSHKHALAWVSAGGFSGERRAGNIDSDDIVDGRDRHVEMNDESRMISVCCVP